VTGSDRVPQTGQKRDRFVIHERDIEVGDRRDPSPEEQAEADRVFNRILKNRKRGRDE
jgi:hypothetical protein